MALLICMMGLLGCAGDNFIEDPRRDLHHAKTSQGPDGKKHKLGGKASWYGKKFHGRKTACGEPFNMHRFTAAHRSLPFHTIVRVWDVATRRSVVVRINDRGPYGKGRVIDLTKAAAMDLGIIKRGVAPVRLDILKWGDGSRCTP